MQALSVPLAPWTVPGRDSNKNQTPEEITKENKAAEGVSVIFVIPETKETNSEGASRAWKRVCS